MKKPMFVYFLIFTGCLFHLLVPDVVFGQAIQVFNRYEETFKHPDIHAHFPDVLNAFKDSENQGFQNPVLISRFADTPRYIRNLYEEADDSILIHLLLDGQFQALFRDPEFHNMLQSSNQIDALVRLIRQTTPRAGDTTRPLPPQPETPRPTTLNILSGNNQSDEVGKFLAQPLVVGVLDQYGKPLERIEVAFTVTAGSGHTSGHTIHTDVYGQARTTLTLGSGAGRHSVTARATGISQTRTFTATADAPPPPPPSPEPEPVVPVRSSTEEPPMYWIEGNVIYYRPIGGVKTIFPAQVDGILRGGLAVDMEGEKVYWTEEKNNGMGRIQSADLDGTNIQTVKETIAVPYDIAFDAEERRLYWTNSFEKIQSINVDGTDFDGDFITKDDFIADLEPSEHTTFLKTPQQIAFDVEKRRLYWTAADGIWSIYTDNDDGIPRRLDKEDLGVVRGIAVFDDVVYWTDQTSSGGRVRFVNRRGSGDKKLLAVLKEIIPMGIAVDPVGGKVYWTTSLREIQSALLPSVQTIVMRRDEPAMLGDAPAGIALGGTAMRQRIQPAGSAPSLSSVGSVENTLLANYPNPFNPETWIPYQLSASADVSVSIYAVDGRLVRRLDLGHQVAGVYRSRSRAAYWDGRNEFGERVASGLYFYTLTAGDFTATRKMLIRK